jgi:aminopeptidase N
MELKSKHTNYYYLVFSLAHPIQLIRPFSFMGKESVDFDFFFDVRYMAVSQMQATDARRAFPCFDEPNMKATFIVTLGRHRDMISLSNMPLVNTTSMQVTLHN